MHTLTETLETLRRRSTAGDPIAALVMLQTFAVDLHRDAFAEAIKKQPAQIIIRREKKC